MEFYETIGIDISKATFDVHMHKHELSAQFDNTEKGFKKFQQWIEKHNSISLDQTLFIFESTGIYSLKINRFLEEKSWHFKIISGLEVKKSLGIVRGKNDKVDAKRLALYGYRRREEIIPTPPMVSGIEKLSRLVSLRKRLVTQRAGFLATYKEYSRILDQQEHGTVIKSIKQTIDFFNEQIKVLEKEMDKLIQQDKFLYELLILITSIPGVGPEIARQMIVITNAFTKFKTWRQFASYVGIAPFPYQSGSSIKGKTKVSHYANKKIKTLLTSIALNAIRYNKEIRAYYKRKIAEGKNKYIVINSIRNKIVARIFAVVKRKTPYVELMSYAG